jgi:DNA-binding winged helix-turn-helix (wHTH) protein
MTDEQHKPRTFSGAQPGRNQTRSRLRSARRTCRALTPPQPTVAQSQVSTPNTQTSHLVVVRLGEHRSTALPAGAYTVLVVIDTLEERDRVVRQLTEPARPPEPKPPQRAAPKQVEIAELCIDHSARRVTVHGKPIRALTALEFKLLTNLVDRADCVQARGTLLSDVWGLHRETATRTVDVHIKRLRDKLGSAGRFIECVRGVGYRFSHTPNSDYDHTTATLRPAGQSLPQ